MCLRAHQQEQTPSYLPSYTRLGHAIPGSKTVSVGGVSRARVNTDHQTLTNLINEEIKYVRSAHGQCYPYNVNSVISKCALITHTVLHHS